MIFLDFSWPSMKCNICLFRDVTEASLNRLRQSGVQIDRIMNPMYLARMRLDQRMQQANVQQQQHPDLVLRLQV